MEPITDHMRHVSLNHRSTDATSIAGVPENARAAVAAGSSSDRGLSAAGAGSTKSSSMTRGSDLVAALAPSDKRTDQRGASAARAGQGGTGAGEGSTDGGMGTDRTPAVSAAVPGTHDGHASTHEAGGNGAAGAGTGATGGAGTGRDRTESSASGSRGSRRRSNPDPAGTVSYNAEHIIGNGSFGVVFQAVVVETGEVVAIKKVLQDKRFKNRELQIMRMLVKKEHPNIVRLKHCFYSNGDKQPDELYLNLVLEFVPETVYSVARQYHKSKQTLPVLLVKLYLYQLARALAHIHALGICHRDIKPQNLLLDPQTHVLKLCDFGSAKILVRGEPNVSYICSRYYRAPELIFGSTDYTCAIDTWSLGCVAAELLLGEPLFPGDSGVDQLVEIIKVLGTPTREEIRAMNSNYSEFKFPQIKAHPWKGVFRARTPPEALDVVSKMLAYDPLKRIKPLEVCSHDFVDELRQPGVQLPNGNALPLLFEFTELELSANPRLLARLLPSSECGDTFAPSEIESSLAAGTSMSASTLDGNSVSGDLDMGRVQQPEAGPAGVPAVEMSGPEAGMGQA